jgi:hypothetical protein
MLGSLNSGLSVSGEYQMTVKGKAANNTLTASQWQATVSDTFFPLETTMAERDSFSGDLDLSPKFPPSLHGVLGVKSVTLGGHFVHVLSLHELHRRQVV